MVDFSVILVFGGCKSLGHHGHSWNSLLLLLLLAPKLQPPPRLRLSSLPLGRLSAERLQSIPSLPPPFEPTAPGTAAMSLTLPQTWQHCVYLYPYSSLGAQTFWAKCCQETGLTNHLCPLGVDSYPLPTSKLIASCGPRMVPSSCKWHESGKGTIHWELLLFQQNSGEMAGLIRTTAPFPKLIAGSWWCRRAMKSQAWATRFMVTLKNGCISNGSYDYVAQSHKLNWTLIMYLNNPYKWPKTNELWAPSYNWYLEDHPN